jgi:hypothetical protein
VLVEYYLFQGPPLDRGIACARAADSQTPAKAIDNCRRKCGAHFYDQIVCYVLMIRCTSTLNLNVRYGQMTSALVAQAAIHQMRQRLGEPFSQ